jgi:hypothetical protein
MIGTLNQGVVCRVALVVTWLATTTAMIVLLLGGVRDTHQFGTIHYVLPGIYVLVMILYLWQTGPPTRELPEMTSPILPQWKLGPLISVLVVALIFALHFFSDLGESILMLLLIIGTIWIIALRWQQIRLRMVVVGFALAIMAFLGGVLYLKHNFISPVAFILLSALVPPMVVAGGLLTRHTRLSGVQLLAGHYGKALKGVLWGCLLFLPLGLTNAASGSPGGDLTWFTQWWMPPVLPWFSGIAEEVWYRLLLVSLCYLMLRPAFRKGAGIAVMGAVLFSGITFGLGHGRTAHNFLTTGLLYGLPMAVIFARRDWEHAVGTHYMVNFIPCLVVFLKI